MPKHKPIRFQNTGFSDDVKNAVNGFVKEHPVISSVARAVLATAILGGVITVGAVAPGMLGVFGKHTAKKHKERRERYQQMWARFHDLRKRGAFEFVRETPNGELIYKFTDKGKKQARKFATETLEISYPKRWDGKWRVVTFDIPEKLKKQRRFFQTKLIELGFYQLQRSVLIHPFPCEHEVEFLKDFLDIKPHVETFVSSGMSNGKVLHSFRQLLRGCV